MIEVKGREELFQGGFFRLDKVTFSHTRLDGSPSEPLERIVFERGDSVAILLHDLKTEEIVLVEQVRIATLGPGDGLLLEVPAGKIDEDESAEEAAIREAKEETGATPNEARRLFDFFPSPGASSERVTLFYCPSASGFPRRDRGGEVAEGEDIRIVRLSLDDAFAALEQGRIHDAKTLVGLQWLQREYELARPGADR